MRAGIVRAGGSEHAVDVDVGDGRRSWYGHRSGVDVRGNAGLPGVDGTERPSFHQELGELAFAGFDERERPHTGDHNAIGDVVVRRSALESEVVHVLLHAGVEIFLVGIRGRGVVDGFRIGVGGLQGQAVAHGGAQVQLQGMECGRSGVGNDIHLIESRVDAIVAGPVFGGYGGFKFIDPCRFVRCAG